MWLQTPSGGECPTTPTLTLRAWHENTVTRAYCIVMRWDSYLVLDWGHSSCLPPVNGFRRITVLDGSASVSSRTILCLPYKLAWPYESDVVYVSTWGSMRYCCLNSSNVISANSFASTVKMRWYSWLQLKLLKQWLAGLLTLVGVSFLVVLVDVIEVLHEHLESCLSLLFWAVFPPILDLPLVELPIVQLYRKTIDGCIIYGKTLLDFLSMLSRCLATTLARACALLTA